MLPPIDSSVTPANDVFTPASPFTLLAVTEPLLFSTVRFPLTSFGSVLAERINGNLTVENSNGSVTARSVKGDAGVKTSFAGVTLESIGGRMAVDNQNGAISVTAMRPASGCRDILLKTSFSSIRVRVPEGVGYNVTARTSFGRISSELPVTSTGSIGCDTLNGTIGSGGCQLQLTG